jgi:hypothetical protein
MQISSVMRQVFTNSQIKENKDNNKNVQLSFKDPRDRGRVLTLDVSKTSFESLLKSFSNKDFAISPDGSVNVDGSAGKLVASWWEAIAYKKRYENGSDKLNIRAHRINEDPYVKSRYIDIGKITKTLNKISDILKEDGKSLKASWLTSAKNLPIESVSILEGRLPTIAVLYFRG